MRDDREIPESGQWSRRESCHSKWYINRRAPARYCLHRTGYPLHQPPTTYCLSPIPSLLSSRNFLSVRLFNMQLSQAILLFATAVSAIDIRLHDNGNCNAAFAGCSNAGTNFCCVNGRGAGAAGVGFHAVPTNWYINYLGGGGTGCSSIISTGAGSGRTDYCLNSKSSPRQQFRYVSLTRRRGRLPGRSIHYQRPTTIRSRRCLRGHLFR